MIGKKHVNELFENKTYYGCHSVFLGELATDPAYTHLFQTGGHRDLEKSI